MALITEASIQEVKDKLDALAVVGDHMRLEKRSGRYWGCCPFHHEKTPSFTVNPDLKTYYCFGCHKGGTVINFLMEMDKLSFPEAVETLARRFGVPLAYENSGGSPAEEGAARQKEELFELYRRTAGTFHHFLLEKTEGGAAKEYIVSRGISIEMIEQFRLGYAPADRRWLYRFLSAKGYSEEFLDKSGLFSSRYRGMPLFAGRLMFPITDRQGRTVAFGGRALPGARQSDGREPPKYINSPELEIYKKGQTFFAIDRALPAIRETGAAYIAEGYMDVIALHQAGIAAAVAPLGTAFTADQARLLRRWAEKVYLFLDADGAGQEATVKAILTCRRNGLAAAVVIPGGGGEAGPGGPEAPPDPAAPKDPAEILQKFGPEALQKAAKCYINDFEYLVNRSKTRFDLSGVEGKAGAAASVFPYVETLDSAVSREACLAALADSLGVDRGAVLHDYRSFERRGGEAGTAAGSRGSGEKSRKEEPLQNTRPVRQNDELSLLIAVSVNQNLYTKFRSALSIGEIEDPFAKELFIALEECFVHDESGMDNLLARVSSEALRNFVLERGSSKEFSVNPEQLIRDGVKKVRRKRLERRLSEIDIRLRIPGRLPEDDENGLLAEKMDIRAELRR
jgi:DNA primase